MSEVIKKVLPNGLTVILQESHAAPVVSMNLCCRVGSRNEGPQEAGLCHVIEHMIFKGTPTYPVGEVARQVEAAGGDINAYTSFDETVFYIHMASRYFNEGLNILTDAALHPLFDAGELTREKEVIVEEISRSDDSPMHQIGEDLFAHAFTRHPYRHPIAGTRESVRASTRAQLMDFYRRWYVGPNLAFVMVGDFDAAHLMSRLQKLLSPFSSKNPPLQKIPVEPAQQRPRSTIRTMNVQGHYLGMGFHAPALTHPDVAALDVLAHVLAGADSSRLDQQLKERLGLVNVVQAECYTPRDPCLFLLEAHLNGPKPREVVTEIFAALNKLISAGVGVAELKRAKTNIVSSMIYERETVEGLAGKLSFFEMTAGDYRFEKQYYQRVEAVSSNDIVRITAQYLKPSQVTLVYCQPESERKPIAAAALLTPLKTKTSPKQRRQRSATTTQTYRLPNGIRLFVKQSALVPLVAIRTASLGGLRSEQAKTNGLFQLLSETVTKGTAHRSAQEIAEGIEAMAGSLSGYAGRNLVGLASTFLAEKMNEGFSLFCDVLRSATFPREEVEREKRHTLTAIREQDDSLPRLAMKELMQILYHPHPYYRPILGTKESVRGLTAEKIRRTFKQWVQPANLVVSVVGDVIPEEVATYLSRKLSDWPRGQVPLLQAPRPSLPQNAITRALKKSGKQQAHIVIGFLGTTVKNQDRYGLDVLNTVLSGQGGRLFLELRDKQGLAYTVTSSVFEGLEAGTVAVYMGTDPKKLTQAVAGIEKELQKLTAHPISRAELKRAQRYLIGSHEFHLQRLSSIATSLAFDAIYGLPFENYLRYADYIQKVTIDEIQHLAKKYLKLDRAVTVIVKP